MGGTGCIVTTGNGSLLGVKQLGCVLTSPSHREQVKERVELYVCSACMPSRHIVVRNLPRYRFCFHNPLKPSGYCLYHQG